MYGGTGSRASFLTSAVRLGLVPTSAPARLLLPLSLVFLVFPVFLLPFLSFGFRVAGARIGRAGRGGIVWHYRRNKAGVSLACGLRNGFGETAVDPGRIQVAEPIGVSAQQTLSRGEEDRASASVERRRRWGPDRKSTRLN